MEMLLNESGNTTKITNNDDIEYRHAHGHIEIYVNGKWYASADNMEEARRIVSGEDDDD